MLAIPGISPRAKNMPPLRGSRKNSNQRSIISTRARIYVRVTLKFSPRVPLVNEVVCLWIIFAGDTLERGMPKTPQVRMRTEEAEAGGDTSPPLLTKEKDIKLAVLKMRRQIR